VSTLPENSPTSPTAEAPYRPAPLREEIPSVLAMATLFIVSLALALAIAPAYSSQGVQAFENPEDPWNSVIYLGIVVVFTFIILLIAKLKLKKVIQFIILGAVFSTIIYVFQPLMNEYLPHVQDVALGGYAWSTYGLIAAALGLVLVATLYFYPEWYVVDAVGIVVSAGAAAIFGISFGLFPSLLLLVGFAVYDAIAVYRTKHMLDLADNVLDLRLPIMFVVPKSRGYSFLHDNKREIRKEAEGKVEKRPREAMFMGLGDVVIPGVLVISSFVNLNPATSTLDPALLTGAPDVLGFSPWGFVAACTFVGTLAGYALLMSFVLRGNPQAGLPSLNGGAIIGFLAAVIPLYGIAPLLP